MLTWGESKGSVARDSLTARAWDEDEGQRQENPHALAFGARVRVGSKNTYVLAQGKSEGLAARNAPTALAWGEVPQG